MKKKSYKVTICFCVLVSLSLFQNIFAQRYWNTAAKFNGTNYVSVVPYYYLQNLSGSFTVECWFNCAPGGYGTLFGKSSFRLLLDPSGNNKVVGRMQTNGNTKLYTRISTAMETNKWYHLACTYDSTSGNMIFYINGNQDTSTVGLQYGPVVGTDTLFIGYSSSAGYYKGMMDDIRVWNRALSSTEILENMRNPYVGPLNYETENFGQGLVMSATFDFLYTGPGSNDLYFYDGYNSFYNKGAEGVILGDHPSTTLTINSALDLTKNGYAKMPSNPDIEFTRPVTVEAWVYPINSTNSSSQYIIKKGTNYEMFLDNQGKVDFVFDAIGSSTVSIPSGKWTHLAITCSAAGIGKIYINGKYDIDFNFGSGPNPGTDTLYIGASSFNTEFFNGYIDAVKISNYEKTEDAINKDMFKIVDFSDRPQPPKSTVSINFDYGDYSSTSNGGWYYFGGGAKNSLTGVADNVPVSPIIGNNILSFPEYKIKYSGKRIPQTNSAGYMEDDSLEIPASQTISTVQLFLALNHQAINELQIYLQSPSGDSVLIWNGNNGVNQYIQHIITVFDDNADSALVNGLYVDFGPYIKPSNPINSVFSGKDAKGIWKLKITDLFNGNTGYLYAWGLRINSVTGVKDIAGNIPKEYKLEQNYPNPFNPSTIIKFSIPKTAFVNIGLYDILGRQIKTLINGEMKEGFHQVVFNGNNLPSGIYIYKMNVDNRSFIKKMLLLK